MPKIPNKLKPTGPEITVKAGDLSSMPPSPAVYTAFLDDSLTLGAEGQWAHQGVPFTNERLNALFLRSIRYVESEQRYYVCIGKERATFRLADTAYFVRQIDTTKSPWLLELLDGHSEALRPETISIGQDHQLYCLVHDKHRARFLRPAHQSLMTYAQDDTHLLIDGKLIAIGPAHG